ncbi:hypothetical protein BOX15_Mlig029313g1 [Macrostomum lignano]|uniref:HAP1 N-terminal domain-containing protein n=3 Tax=Macrostomum lignano TaxID=282301 RepID=A0A267FWL9_9PLAT|nr:hypothetical protein BOX15_Mlig029313g1 [Macrostomum lignano]
MGDIEEIKQQLEERDKELALAASLGNDLLDRNRELESKCENLEKLLASERDAAAQLRHELSMKEELLVIYAMNEDRQQSKQAASRSLSVENASSLQKASLERRLHQLESENSELRAAAAAASAANDRQRWGPDAERETALVKDCVRQLAESNLHIKSLADNLNQRTEMYMEQQNEITQLFAKNVSLESKVKRVSMERDMQETRLKETQLTQRALTSELACLHDRYDECIALLDRSQHEAASLRRRLKSAVNRSSSAAAAAAAVTMQNSDRPHQLAPQHPAASGAAGRGGGVVAGASPVAPPPPYELSLMSELERSASAESGLIGSSHYIRNVKSANATGQSIRRRHQQQQQQHHAPSNSRQNNHHHNRNIQLQAAVSVENLRQTVSSPMSSTVELQRRPKSAGVAGAGSIGSGCRSMSLGGGGVSGAGDGSGLEPDCCREISKSVSVGNLTSPLMESSSTQLATETGNNSTVNNSGFIIDSEFTSAETAAEVSSPKLTLRQGWREKCMRQSAVAYYSQHSPANQRAAPNSSSRPARFRRCLRRHHHGSAEIMAAASASTARHLSSSVSSLCSLASDAAVLVSTSSLEFDEYEQEEAAEDNDDDEDVEEDEEVSMATSTQTQIQTQTETQASNSQQGESEMPQGQLSPFGAATSTQATAAVGASSTPSHRHCQRRRQQQQQQQDQHCRLAWLGTGTNFNYATDANRRLQFVKTLSGSSTLAQWRRLATPGLHAAVAPRRLRGVATRGDNEDDAGRNDSEDDEDEQCNAGMLEDEKFYSSNGQTAQSAMLLSQLQPSHRATSLDAGINNCFVEIADSVKPRSRHPLHRQRHLTTSLNNFARLADPASPAEIGEDTAENPVAKASHGWLLPSIGASILRGLLQLSLVTAGMVENDGQVDSEDGDGTCSEGEASDLAFELPDSAGEQLLKDPRAGLNLFCPATGEVRRSSSATDLSDVTVLHRVWNV